MILAYITNSGVPHSQDLGEEDDMIGSEAQRLSQGTHCGLLSNFTSRMFHDQIRPQALTTLQNFDLGQAALSL